MIAETLEKPLGGASQTCEVTIPVCGQVEVAATIAAVNHDQPVIENDNPTEKPKRLLSLEAYRGFIVLAMVAGDVGLTQIRDHLDGSWLGAFVAHHTEHVPWAGCSFWDLIQPSFLFMVGVAMPYSYTSRLARGQSETWIFAHVLFRSAVLVLPIVVASYIQAIAVPLWSQSNLGFTHVLVQIGLAYGFVYLLLGRSVRVRLAAVAGILVGYTLLFAIFGGLASSFTFDTGGPDSSRSLAGWFAHRDIHTNAAAAFDRWFLNLFPRSAPFSENLGGYQTLNFVPSMATMLLGLMAGELLRGPRGSREKFWVLLQAGAACLALGWLAGEFVCPIVKRIWTPSWAILSAGWAFLMLASFFWLIDVKAYRTWAMPMIVAGANCITLYVLAQIVKGWSRSDGPLSLNYYGIAGVYGPAVQSALAFLLLWLVCLWLYRCALFLRL